MGNRISAFHKVPFSNKFGQTISPGEKIVFAATAWKNTNIKQGTFDGVNKDSNGEITSVRVSYPMNKYVPNGKTETITYKTMDYHTRQYVEKSYERALYDAVPGIGYSTLPLKRVFKLAE